MHGAGSTAGAAEAIKITGDSLVDFGDGKPVKWSEASDPDKGRYVTRDRFDRGVQYLNEEAQKLQKKWDDYHAGVGARPAKAEPAAAAADDDPMADIRDLSMVDGRSLEKLYKNLMSKGMGPLANVVAQMATRLQQLEGNVGKIGKTSGTLAERESAQEFEGLITKSFESIGDIKGLPEGAALKSDNPFLRELAKDVYLSHDSASWKAGEFSKTLNARITEMIGLVRSLDKSALESAKDKKRVWLRPGGAGTPSGNAPRKFQRGADIAKMFFGEAQGART